MCQERYGLQGRQTPTYLASLISLRCVEIFEHIVNPKIDQEHCATLGLAVRHGATRLSASRDRDPDS